MLRIRAVFLCGLLIFNIAMADDVTTENQKPVTGNWWYDPKAATNQASQAITGATDKDKNAQNFKNSVSKKNWPNQLKVGPSNE